MMAASIKEGKSADDILNEKISNRMTPINQVIYGRPDETIAMCRAIMAKLGIKCLPILAEGRVEGILTARDMQEIYFDAKDRGGKKNYLRDVSERVGLSSETSMASNKNQSAEFQSLFCWLIFPSRCYYPIITGGSTSVRQTAFGAEARPAVLECRRRGVSAPVQKRGWDW